MVKIITTNRMSRGRWVAAVGCVGIALVAGFLGGWFSSQYMDNMVSPNVDWQRPDDPHLGKRLRRYISTAQIEENLRKVSEHPHMAGSVQNKELAEQLRDLWLEQGLDSTGIDNYKVLLSFPGNSSNPNMIEVITDVGSTHYRAPMLGEFTGKPFVKDNPGLYTPYVSFSKAGTVEAEAVFIGQATTLEELEFLKRNVSVDIAGKIVLACPSAQHSIAELALAVEVQGAKGLILFPNPMEAAPLGAEHVFPRNKWLPGYTAKREIFSPSNPGDSLTPGYPAKDYAFRLDYDDVKSPVRPSIPIQTVGYQVGLDIMKQFDDSTPEVNFFGLGTMDHLERLGLGQALPFTLRHGGRMKYGRKVRLTVNNRLEQTTIYNTCGIIKGAIEPDRLVVVGNHRDAWVFGAVDPGGGTAVMMELVRVVGLLKKQGWRPRRSLIFCSWDAEEFGLVGSMEWVEDKIVILTHKAVAYINLDIAVMGRTHLTATASPLLNQLIFDTARKVPHPHFPTLYDAWRNFSLSQWPRPSKPRVNLMAPNSDHVSFLMRAGVPSAKVWLRNEGWSYYLAYHTAIDTYDYVKRIVDPTFEYHRMMADFHAELVGRLVDDTVLPMRPKDYAFLLQNVVLNFKVPAAWAESGVTHFFRGQGRKLMERLEFAVGNFSHAALTFQNEIDVLDRLQPYKVREANDKLVLLEKSFIDHNWRVEDPVYKHVLLSPSLTDGSLLVPGITDALNVPTVRNKLTQNQQLSQKEMKNIEKEFAVILHALDRATDVMVI